MNNPRPDTVQTTEKAGFQPAIAIAGLGLINFRNHNETVLRLDGRSVVLTGANGAGKTNILEAISLFAPGRGMRAAKMSDFATASRQPPAGWSAVIDLTTPYNTHRLGTGSDPANPALPRRVLQIDQKPASQNSLCDYLTLAWATPDMDRLWVDSPSARRKFLDRLVYAIYPDHWPQLNILEKSRAERAKLLELGRMDDRWLNAVERAMAESSCAITHNRGQYIARLNEKIGGFAPTFPPITIELHSPIAQQIGISGQNAAQDWLAEQLRQSRGRDQITGSAKFGAHKDDIGAHHGIKNRPASECSTGEQKIAVLSVLLAHADITRIKTGRPPILILDEMAAHLDAYHRDALRQAVLFLNVQTWISGADPGLFQGWENDAQFIAVKGGKISV